MANKFVPLEELKETREWICLSPIQRQLVEAYISNGYDKSAACKAAGYKCGTKGGMYVTVSRSFGNKPVKALLALHFGDTALDLFKQELEAAIRNPRMNYARLQTLRLMAKIHGFDTTALEEGITADSVKKEKVVAEKIIEKDGKRYKTTVTEVSE